MAVSETRHAAAKATIKATAKNAVDGCMDDLSDLLDGLSEDDQQDMRGDAYLDNFADISPVHQEAAEKARKHISTHRARVRRGEPVSVA